MVSRRLLLLAGAVALGLAACAGTPEPMSRPEPGPALRLAVGTVTVEDAYAPLPQANFIDERRTRELAGLARDQIGRRLEAAGGAGWARATLREVALTERLADERRGGVTGLVTREPTWTLEGTLAGRVAIVDEFGGERAFAEARVGRTRQLPAGTSVIERDNAARSLMADLLAQFDAAFERSVRENLGDQLAGW
jgi:hypothetical protein